MITRESRLLGSPFPLSRVTNSRANLNSSSNIKFLRPHKCVAIGARNQLLFIGKEGADWAECVPPTPDSLQPPFCVCFCPAAVLDSRPISPPPQHNTPTTFFHFSGWPNFAVELSMSAQFLGGSNKSHTLPNCVKAIFDKT